MSTRRGSLAAAAALLATPGLVSCGGETQAQSSTTSTRPGPTTLAPTTTAEPTTAPEPPQPPPTRPFSWESAGAFVWHETDVDPTTLGNSLRDNGFGWAVVFLHDGLTEDPVDAGWIERFRLASGLPVGGWGVLRSEPEREAELADSLLARYGLEFYVADAEGDYEYSGPGGPSPERLGRSRRFVHAFRARRATLPAGLSTYCRADRHDIDWKPWRDTGFVLLPQAYANQFGAAATPATCVRAARAFFPREDVHPTVGLYAVRGRLASAPANARLLARAGTVGFSVYLAETTSAEQWQQFGQAIAERRLAR